MAESSASSPSPSPDAILYQDSLKKGRSSLDRATFVQKLLGPRLGGKAHTELGPEHGGRVYSRDVGGGWWMATLNADDTLLFPTDHEYARLPRYRWEDQEDGTRNGTMLTAEELEEQATAETPAQKQLREMSAAAVKRSAVDNAARMARWHELVARGHDRTPEETAELRKLRDVERFKKLIAEGVLNDPFAEPAHV